MGKCTFKGGIHPYDGKELSKDKPIKELFPAVGEMVFPLSQHIGAPAVPVVAKGDYVLAGQLIAEAGGFVSANIHSSVSGTVKAIEPRTLATGGKCNSIIIENDGEFKEVEYTPKKLEELSKEEVLQRIKDAGVVGMGGAGFPTNVKLSPKNPEGIDYIIVNGAECEPYLTADHRLMVEMPDDVVFGIRAVMRALDVHKGYIGIEVNKPDAIEAVTKAAEPYPEVEVVGLEIKYPQGAEKQLIYACTGGREVPSGALPAAAGAVVTNVGTAAQIAKSIKTGLPLIERITTITGDAIKDPKNLITKVGTPICEIIDQCGGFKEGVNVGKVILGGPMMGNTQYTTQAASTKGTSGILCLSEEKARIPEPTACLRCGRCTEVCPAFLQPLYISANSLKGDFDKAEEHRALDCIECGSCSFICPARRPLVESIRNAKRQIQAKRRKAQAEAKAKAAK